MKNKITQLQINPNYMSGISKLTLSFLIIFFLGFTQNSYAQCCNTQVLTKWNMDACQGCTSPYNTSFSEFSATTVSSCVSQTASKITSTSNIHSCVPGQSSKALCTPAGNTFYFQSIYSPNSSQKVSITQLKYYTMSPTSFNGYGSCYGPYSASHSSQYILKVKKNGSVVYQTTKSLPYSWALHTINLSGVSQLQNMTSSATIKVELTSSYVSNAFMDIDEFEIKGTVCPTGPCDPNDQTASNGFCAPAPNCSGSNKWTWSQSINSSNGSPSVVRLINSSKLTHDITSGIPTVLKSGPVNITITDAVSYDGYVNRSNTGNQPNERWRLKFYKGSSLVYTSPYTSDGIATGVEQDYWRGSLGSQVTLANGFDKVRIEHYAVGNSGGSAGSVVPASFCISYTACDNVTNGGVIAGAENKCGPYNPTTITSTTAASGGSGGTIEYIWIKNSSASMTGATTIAGATGLTYNPPTIHKTTYYRRCARRSVGCTDYSGESNWVKKEVKFCAPSPICTGTEKFAWSQSIDPATGTPSVVRLINSSKLTHTITSGIPTAAKSGPMNITITDAVSWDGYASRANVVQTNEKWRLKLYKGTTLVYTSPYTNDVPDNLVQASWRGALGTSTYLSNGFDKVVIDHIGGSGPGSVVPASFCIKYDPCDNISSPGSIAQSYTYCDSGNPPAFTSVNNATGGCGGSIQYQWQKRVGTSGSWSNISGATSATYNQGTTTTTTQFRRAAKRSWSSTWKYTNILTITINKKLASGGTVGSNQSFCNSGNPAAFTNVTSASGGIGGSIQYQWQKRTGTSGTFTNISGATSSTYNAPSISTTTQYRRRARRSLCAGYKYSNTLTVTIVPGVDAGNDGSTTVCDHSTSTINLAGLITGEDAGGTWTRTQGTGGTFNASAGTFVPAVGATTSKFKYTVNGTSPCPNDFSYATVNINVCQIVISGNLFNDVNALTDNDVNGVGIGNPGSVPMYANLVDGSGNVVATATIGNNGSYQIPNVTTNTTYTMVLSTVEGTVGNPAPAPNVPSDWMNTGESPNNATSDGTVDGKQVVVVGTSNVPNIDFGIQQPPTPGTNTQPSQVNPGGNTFVTIPSNAFSGNDPNPGIVTSLRITSFPTNASSIKINGTTYTSSNWPANGVSIPTNANGVPTQTVEIDPINGAVVVNIPYKVTDNAGVESSTTGFVKKPFTVIGISGNVFEDNNGPTNVDGTGIGNPSSTQLYANLVDASGDVVATDAVNANGTYNFNEVTPNMTYTVVLSTTQGTVGNPAPTADLPFGWENVSEDCCNNSGNDGNTNGITTVSVGTTNKTNVNFGITQPLTIGNRVFNDKNQDGNRDSGEPYIGGATVKLYADDNNDGTPDGAALQTKTTSSSGVYRFDGLTPGKYIVGVTPPTPASGPAYESTDGPAQSIDPNNNINNDDNGINTVAGETFTGTIDMMAGTEPTNDDTYNGIPDNNSNMSIDFGFFQPIKLSGVVFNDESGPANVDGSPIGQASGQQLYANLIDASGDVEAVTPISNAGMYEFTDVDPNTAYQVVLTDAAGTVGNAAPTPSLPTGWLTVSEDCCDGIGNDGNPDGINIAPTVTDDLPMVNFGIREPVAIGNSVWVDSNKNGIKDAGELPMGGAIVNIYEDNNNDNTPDGPAIGTMTTGNDGLYKFVDLHSGKYIIGVTAPTVQGGTYESSFIGQEENPNLDVDNNDNGINKQTNGEVLSKTVNLISNTEPQGETPNNTSGVPDSNSNLTVDFGFYVCPDDFDFTPVPVCAGTTVDLTSLEPAEFGGGIWTDSVTNQTVANPTAVTSGTYTYTFTSGDCSASGNIKLNDNVPDYTPTIQISPGTIVYSDTITPGGDSTVNVLIRVTELQNFEACSDLYIIVPKLLPRYYFTWEPNRTSLPGFGETLENLNWQFFPNANPNFYIWKYIGTGGLYPALGDSYLGYTGFYNPNNTDGKSTFSVQIFQGSGGETNQNNNTSSTVLVYFR